ncbi:MAG: hypothetical protein E7137_00680 [Rikenellaceae bacterium]|nr:hypothetical protein [Rikenellaceae bacterium]
MKKFYSFLFAAVALVGFAACNSDSTEEPAPAGAEKLSFKANIDTTKTDLDGLQTVWCEGDVVVIDGFNFVCGNDLATFTCTEAGCTSLLNKEVEAVYSNKKDGKIDSEAGVHGALLTATGTLTTEGATFEFAVQNAFLKLTTTGTVTLKGAGLFSTGDELTIAEDGEHYVAINPAADVAFSCESNGITMKNTTITFEKKKIYNLGELQVPTVFCVEGNAAFNLYAWSGDDKFLGDWPGTAMTQIGSTNKYYAVIPDEYVGETFNYIVNWTGGQTKDLIVNEFASGYTYSISDPDPENITIYLNNNWSVQNLKIHSWDPTLWAGQTWENQKAPDGTVTNDLGTFSYWNIDKNQIKTDKVGSLLVTGTGKKTADLHNVNYENDVYLQFVYKDNKDQLEILTTPY